MIVLSCKRNPALTRKRPATEDTEATEKIGFSESQKDRLRFQSSLKPWQKPHSLWARWLFHRLALGESVFFGCLALEVVLQLGNADFEAVLFLTRSSRADSPRGEKALGSSSTRSAVSVRRSMSNKGSTRPLRPGSITSRTGRHVGGQHYATARQGIHQRPGKDEWDRQVDVQVAQTENVG